MNRIGKYLVALSLALFASAAFAEPAAQLLFGSGTVTAVDSRGYPRTLAQGSDVNTGDTVITAADARAQLRFADGGIVSLQPDSRLRIDDYRFGGAVAEERGFFSLIKGGLRAISGALGKYNRAAYRLATPVATVGIRGTHFTLQLCAADCVDVGKPIANGLYASVVEGQIELSNSVGAFVLDQGQSAFIANMNSAPTPSVLPPRFHSDRERARRPHRPIATTQLPLAALKQPPNAPMLAVLASVAPDQPINTYDQAGLPVALFDGNKQTAIGGLRVFGLGTATADGYDQRYFKTFSINDKGQLVSLGLNPETVHGSNAIVDSGYSGLIGWGRWTGGETVQDPAGTGLVFKSPASLHYVITGEPTPAVFFANVASLIYTFVAGTPSTSADGTIGVGITGGTLTLTTGAAPTVAANFSVDHAGNVYSVLASAMPVNADAAAFGGIANATAPGSNACGNGCASSINGIFAGPLAQEAGIVYEIGEPTPIHGAGVFR